MENEKARAKELTGEELELTITSDGTPHGTVITDARTGSPLLRVAEVRLHIKAGEPFGTAEITLTKSKMNLTGRFKVVEGSGS